MHGPPSPSCRMRGVRRTIGTVQKRKAAATVDLVRAMLDACPDTMIGLRDRALLALGFAGAFRRSELVALQVSDLTEVPDGYRVIIRRSKTDQSGEGQEIVIPRGLKIRPVAACSHGYKPPASRRLSVQGGAQRRRCTPLGHFRSSGRRSGEAICVGCRVGSARVQWTQLTRRVCHECGRDWRLDPEDSGDIAAQEHRRVGRLCPARGYVQGPRGDNIPVIRNELAKLLCLPDRHFLLVPRTDRFDRLPERSS